MTTEKINYIRSIQQLFMDICCEDVATYIGCQFALESNFGKSTLALNHNNHSGMKRPLSRFSYDNLSHPVFAGYNDLYECIFDYKLLLAWNRFTKSFLLDLDLFRKRLEMSGYCSDFDYIERINRIYLSYIDELLYEQLP